MEALFMQLQSLCIVLLMFAGILVRRRRKLHVKIMSAAMIWDVLLILQIELSRSAIIKASNAMTNATALNVHVAIAVSTVILYAFMVYTGRALLAGQNQVRQNHKRLGYITFAMRILTFVTSFWAVAPKV
jgi:pyrimidine operon attenuation protein/uracil phosphoribosyltransferase